jgi:hypothetical protein
LASDSGRDRERLSGHPVWVLDIKVKMLRNQVIKMVKVQWTCYGLEDATWEHEDTMQAEYPHIFE